MTSISSTAAWSQSSPLFHSEETQASAAEGTSALGTAYNYGYSLVAGVASIGALMLTWPIDLEARNPIHEECDPNQTPILMIHGFTGSSNNWLFHKHHLSKAGHRNIFTINLGSAFQDMDSCADKVRDMVDLIKERTGRSDLKIVGHSMGGLVAIHYRQKYEDHVEVKDIVTLGAPLDGTRIAVIAQASPLARQMVHGSEFVYQLQKNMERDENTRYLHVVSNCDWFIWPSYSAGAGTAPKTKIIHLDRTGHVPFLFSKSTSQAIIEQLSQ